MKLMNISSKGRFQGFKLTEGSAWLCRKRGDMHAMVRAFFSSSDNNIRVHCWKYPVIYIIKMRSKIKLNQESQCFNQPSSQLVIMLPRALLALTIMPRMSHNYLVCLQVKCDFRCLVMHSARAVLPNWSRYFRVYGKCNFRCSAMYFAVTVLPHMSHCFR